MIEKLVPLTLPPGIYRNGSEYQSKGRWYDGTLVRFFENTIRPVGGWRRVTDATGANLAAVAGTPRALLAWRASAGDQWVAIGTTSKLYVLAGGTLFDETPVGFVTGRVDSVYSSGNFGDSSYGVGAYGQGSVSATLLEAGTWQLDTFGQFLVAVSTSDSKLYVWQAATGVVAAQASGSPTCRGVVTTPERFLVALGAAGDVRLVQWASQQTFATWTPATTNTAGSLQLVTNGRIMCGRRTKSETLIWTDADMHRMTYIGGTLVYRIDQVGDQCGITAPNAVAVVDSSAFWMGRNAFYLYNGVVQQLPCDVADYVFGDLNDTQRAKIWAQVIPAYGEVWWYYPSSGSTEIDRYVSYSYREGHWEIGKLSRTAGTPGGVLAYPILTDSSGLLYEHEVGFDHSGLTPYIESGPVELGDGDNVMKIQRIVPDEKTLGDVQATLYTAMFPTDTFVANGPYTAAAPTSVRLTARLTRLRLSEVRATDWRVGLMRLGGVLGGRR